ncbi:MAG: tetratricopeptide repeat protein [Proteobacteria bacterium]|nr:tetratricopeptide repeat protein [Pseudomonadota bacterium]
MVDIFDEVEEDLRAERVQRLLRHHGGKMVVAALAVVAAVSGWQAWRWYAARQDMQAAASFIAAMNVADAIPADAKAGARAPAIAALQKAADAAPMGYRSLARLWIAAEQSGAGQSDAASATWTVLSDDSATDPILRDLAGLLWAQHNLDKGDPKQIETRLQALAGLNNPWRPLAQEYLALLYIRTGKPDQARETLKQLAADRTAPDGLRNRAAGLLDQLGG